MKRLLPLCVLTFAGCGGQTEPAAMEEPPIVEVYEQCGAESAAERQTIDEFVDAITTRQNDGEMRGEVFEALTGDVRSTDDWPTLTPEEQQSTLSCIELSVDLVFGSR